MLMEISLSIGNLGSTITSIDITFKDAVPIVVTVSNGKYYFDGIEAPVLDFIKNTIYTFDVSDPSLTHHPLKFDAPSITNQENNGVPEILDQPSNYNLNLQMKMMYMNMLLTMYCENHPGMGNFITVNPAKNNGRIIDNNDGTWTVTTSNADFNGTVDLTYNVIDGSGGSFVAENSITIVEPLIFDNSTLKIAVDEWYEDAALATTNMVTYQLQDMSQGPHGLLKFIPY